MILVGLSEMIRDFGHKKSEQPPQNLSDIVGKIEASIIKLHRLGLKEAEKDYLKLYGGLETAYPELLSPDHSLINQ